MPTVADVLRRYGEEYLQRFGAKMPAEHKKVLRTLTACRTGELGTVIYVCQSCGTTHAMGRSCGNRHCPSCQQDKTKAWLENQTDRLLPCPYFLLTFTVPAGLRDLVRSHQRIVSCDDGQVTFSYCRSGSNRQRKMTVDAFEFIRRFLQHVLPSGFQKVRHYGFLSPNSHHSIEAVRWLITLYYGLIYVLLAKLPQEVSNQPGTRCAECGGPMRVLMFQPPALLAYFDTS
jgi:hypothetical protein